MKFFGIFFCILKKTLGNNTGRVKRQERGKGFPAITSIYSKRDEK